MQALLAHKCFQQMWHSISIICNMQQQQCFVAHEALGHCLYNCGCYWHIIIVGNYSLTSSVCQSDSLCNGCRLANQLWHSIWVISHITCAACISFTCVFPSLRCVLHISLWGLMITLNCSSNQEQQESNKTSICTWLCKPGHPWVMHWISDLSSKRVLPHQILKCCSSVTCQHLKVLRHDATHIHKWFLDKFDAHNVMAF